MPKADFRSQGARFARSERGSALISTALFVIAVLCTALVAVLGALGLLVAPRLVYLVFGVILVAAGWDMWRERRKDRGR